MKYIIGKYCMTKRHWHCDFIAIMFCIYAYALCGCDDYVCPLPANYNPEIVIKNNLNQPVVVVIVPSEITHALIENGNYHTTTIIPSQHIGKCQYYTSYYGDFFSLSKKINIFIINYDIFTSSELENIIESSDKYLLKCTLNKQTLLLSDAVGRIGLYDNEVKLLFGY